MAWLLWGGAVSGMWWIYRQSKKSFWILFCFAALPNFRQKGSPQRICERTKTHTSESDLGGVRIKNKVLLVVLNVDKRRPIPETRRGEFLRLKGAHWILNAWYLSPSMLPSYNVVKHDRLWGFGILLDFLINLFYDRVFQFWIVFLPH